MKHGASLFLKAVLVLIGIGALTFLLFEPHVEGRNAHATLFEIYFKDPFLAYAYVGSLPFFVGLFHAFKVLGHAGSGQPLSPSAVRSLRTIRYCAIATIGFVALGEVFILLSESDDRAGGVAIGAFIGLASIGVATATTVLERAARTAVAAQPESDSR